MRWQTDISSLCCRRGWRAVSAFSLFSQTPKHSQPKLVCSVCLYRWILCITLFYTKIQLSFAYILFYIINPLTPAWNTCAGMQNLHKQDRVPFPLFAPRLSKDTTCLPLLLHKSCWTVFDLCRGTGFQHKWGLWSLFSDGCRKKSFHLQFVDNLKWGVSPALQLLRWKQE